MTRDEFIDGYVTRYQRHTSSIVRTPLGFRIADHEYVAMPCDCGSDGCAGWAMIANDGEHMTTNLTPSTGGVSYGLTTKE